MTRYILEVDRSRVSRAHAALAKVSTRNGHESWLVVVKATLMGDEPEDVCRYHRAHPEFPQETTNDQFFDEAQWESYRRLGLHVGHRVLTPELFTQLEATAGVVTHHVCRSWFIRSALTSRRDLGAHLGA